MAQLNPHRTRNHGSIEHRESIKRMLDKTKKDNRVKVLRGQLQKMAVRFTSSFGPDWDAIDAFKSKEKYLSKKFESTGNELKLNGHVVARHHKDGIEVSNAGHDTNKTYSTIKGLGIHARNQKGITKLNNKVIDVNSGEFVLVPHKDISDKPITYTKTKPQKRYRSVGEQSKFRDLVEKNEAVIQGRKNKLPLSQINVQPKDQKQINKITGVKSPIGKEILGVEAHHILSHKKNPGLRTNINNGIMIPKQDHKMLTSFAKLKQRVALISENTTRPSMKSLAQEITNKFKANKLGGSVKGGFTYDPTSDTLLDASIKEQALQIRKIFGGQKGKNLGLNSITEDDMGNKPITDIGIISNQLHKLEKSGKKPILGGYKQGLNASFSIHGSDKDILKSLPHGQESSLSIEPNGNSYLLYPNGKKELITK